MPLNKIWIAILLLLISLNAQSQPNNNRHASISKKEFAELTSHRNDFIPSDIAQYKVVIIKYTPEELEQMHLKTRYDCLNEDIISSEKDKEKEKQVLIKTASEYPENLKKELALHGISSIIKTESDLIDLNVKEYRYVFKPVYICSTTKRNWILTMSAFFHDRLQNHDYQLFLPINHNVLDLIQSHQQID